MNLDEEKDAIIEALDRAGMVLLWTPETGYRVRPVGATEDDRFTPGGHLVFNEALESARFEAWGTRTFGAKWRGDEAMVAAADMLRGGWLAKARDVAISAEPDPPA